MTFFLIEVSPTALQMPINISGELREEEEEVESSSEEEIEKKPKKEKAATPVCLLSGILRRPSGGAVFQRVT